MEFDELQKLSDELSETALSYPGVLRQTVIKVHGRKNKKGVSNVGVSIFISQYVDGVSMQCNAIANDGLIDPADVLRKGHALLDKALVGIRGEAPAEVAP